MAATRITVYNNGPLRVEGDFEICDPQGKAYGLAGRTTVALCRCGHSANKPFCVGSRLNASLDHQSEAFDLAPPKPKA